MPRSFAPLATLPGTRSNAYSGVCTPITSNPTSLLARYQSTTWGIARWQLMHEYAQKSTKTTLPRNDFRSIAEPLGVLSQPEMPVRSGAVPQLSRTGAPFVQLDSSLF